MSTKKADAALFNEIDIGLTAIYETLELLKNECLTGSDDPPPTASVLILVLPELQRLMTLAENAQFPAREAA